MDVTYVRRIMETKLSILMAAFGAITIAATFYNFQRAPHAEAARNRRLVFIAITLYALGVSIDLTGVFSQLGVTDWYTGELVAHITMLAGSGVFLGFSLLTYRSVLKHLDSHGDHVLRRLARYFISSPHLFVSSAAVASLFPLWAYYALTGPTYVLRAAMNDATHVFVALLFLASLWVWVNIERITKNLRNLGFAISTIILAESSHFLDELGVQSGWFAAAYLVLLFISMTFWISATFEVADGTR